MKAIFSGEARRLEEAAAGGSVVRGLPPVVGPAARVLIVGSMPGRVSLRERQYYAHPRNVFWDIMGEMFGAGRQVEYARRLEMLKARGVALWDVVAECRRDGSADAAIRRGGIRINDLDAFCRVNSSIRVVCFNGMTAFRLAEREAAARGGGWLAGVERVVLPSTSPANRRRGRRERAREWRVVLEAVLQGGRVPVEATGGRRRGALRE